MHLVSAVRSEDGKGRRAFNLQADLDLLEREIIESATCGWSSSTRLAPTWGPKIDLHVNAAVRGILEPVGEMAERLRVAVLCITHPPKGTGTSAINRFIGSIAFVAAARAAFMVTRDADDEDRRLFLPVKNNLAPLGKGLAFRLEQRIVGDPDKAIVGSSVTWESEPVTITADQALQATDGGGGDRSAANEAEEFLRDKLSQGPVPAKDVRGACASARHARPHPRPSPQEAGMWQLRRAVLNGRWFWSLPPEGCQTIPKAAIQNSWHSSAQVGSLRENSAPALGPPGDSLDDFGA